MRPQTLLRVLDVFRGPRPPSPTLGRMPARPWASVWPVLQAGVCSFDSTICPHEQLKMRCKIANFPATSKRSVVQIEWDNTSMQRTITTAAAAAKKILPRMWFVWLKDHWVRSLGPASIHMILDDLENLPSVELPEAYHVTSVEPGGEMDYVSVVRASLDPAADGVWFRESFQGDPEYDPRNLLIIRKGDAPVAVAAAWQTTWEGGKIGLIHNVGVDADFLGQGLGRAVTILALQRLRERGFKRALLASEDYRIPALSLYLSLGFRPVHFSLLHKWRWRRIRQRAHAATALRKSANTSRPRAAIR